jgi:hypothetical protein
MTAQVFQDRVTLTAVNRAWAEAVKAADRFVDYPTDRNRENMCMSADYASELQELYYQQYAEWAVA